MDAGRRHQPTDGRGGGVVGMAVGPCGHGQWVLGAGGGSGGDGQGGGRAEATGHGYLRANGDGQAVGPGHVDGHPGGQMGGVVGDARPLAFRADEELRGRLDLDLDVAVEGDGQGVEPRPEVGRRGRGSCAHDGYGSRGPAPRRGRPRPRLPERVRTTGHPWRTRHHHDGSRTVARSGARAPTRAGSRSSSRRRRSDSPGRDPARHRADAGNRVDVHPGPGEDLGRRTTCARRPRAGTRPRRR